MVNLETRFAGLTLKSPIIVSSASITETVERMKKCQDYGAGAVVVKSYFEEELNRTSPTPRFKILEHNMGKSKTFTLYSYEQGSVWDIHRYAEEVSTAKKQLNIKIIPSINCITEEGWIESARILEKAGADAIELNTSCPHGSITFRGGAVEETIAKTVEAVCNAIRIPVIAKISSMLTSPLALVQRLDQTGVKAVTMLNRMTGLEIDVEQERPILHGGYAGHGGPWAIQYSLRWISQVRSLVKLDIAGSGGVADWRDVVKYLLVGANAVQICTIVILNGYQVIEDLLKGLEEYMEKKGYERLDDFRGKINSKILPAEQVDRRHRYVADIRLDLEPPCNYACPAGVPAQSYVRLIADGKYAEALELIRTKNPFQSICGRICYAPCEENCTRGDLDEPIAIKALKRFATEWGEKHAPLDRLEPPPVEKTGSKVAIIGSGPAGLGAAHDLARMGHDVTVYEQASKPGGMMRYGIPEYRLPKSLLDKEIEYIQRCRVTIRTNTTFGKDIALSSLQKDGYKAILIAAGSQQEINLGIPGAETENVLSALQFLKKVNSGEKIHIPKKIVIVGGGNSAIDAARCAVRLGATDVYLVYRRTKDEMPATREEIRDAEEEGVRIIYLAKPLRIQVTNNKIAGLTCIGGYLGTPGKDRRREHIAVDGMEYTVPAEMIITALGQHPDAALFRAAGLEVNEDGIITADEETGTTNITGIFAAGDVAGRPGSVIEAIAHGKRVALYIDQFLKGNDPKAIAPLIPHATVVNKKDVLARSMEEQIAKRIETPRIPLDERKKRFSEVELRLSENQARQEAQRCLACGCGVGCDLCHRICIFSAVTRLDNKYKVDRTVCDGCGICMERCPNKAITIIEK